MCIRDRAGRIASEGMVEIHLSEDNKSGAIVEVNSETDFVAKNQVFRDYVAAVAKQASETSAKDMDAFFEEKWAADPQYTVKEALSQQVAVIGENLNIRRFEKYEKAQAGKLVSYVHGGGRIGVLIELACEKECDELVELGKNVAMQIAALKPQFITEKDVPADFIEKETEILTAQAKNDPKNANKPDNIIAKMIEGRLKKELKEFCLVDQPYVKDGDLTVQKYIDSVAKEIGADIQIVRYVRFETGEGLEKKDENFAEEVAKAMN